jgi:nucleoside-diphosphate kinase
MSYFRTTASGIGYTKDRTDQLAHGTVWAFNCEYEDKQSMLFKNFLIKYYVDDDKIEIIDLGSRKLFLKKTSRPASLNRKDFHVNGTLEVHGRSYQVLDYADAYTRQCIESKREEAFIVHPAGQGLGEVFEAIDKHDMQIKRVNAVYDSNNNVMVAISAIGADANNVLNAEGVKTRRDLSDDAAGKSAYFTDSANFAGQLNSSTCVVIQPSAVAADQTGGIIKSIIDQGYEISGMGMFQLTSVEAAEFLEVYKDVVPTYRAKVNELSSGPCIALEVRAERPVETFRMTAGPWDVEMARELAPDSIRGTFGMDNTRNAVHCTDLPSDAYDEVNYFFGNGSEAAMVKPIAVAY